MLASEITQVVQEVFSKLDVGDWEIHSENNNICFSNISTGDSTESISVTSLENEHTSSKLEINELLHLALEKLADLLRNRTTRSVLVINGDDLHFSTYLLDKSRLLVYTRSRHSLSELVYETKLRNP